MHFGLKILALLVLFSSLSVVAFAQSDFPDVQSVLSDVMAGFNKFFSGITGAQVADAIASDSIVYCDKLGRGILEMFSASCSSPSYNPSFDLNKDKMVDVNDLVLLSSRSKENQWCFERSVDMTNPCKPAQPVQDVQPQLPSEYAGSTVKTGDAASSSGVSAETSGKEELLEAVRVALNVPEKSRGGIGQSCYEDKTCDATVPLECNGVALKCEVQTLSYTDTELSTRCVCAQQ